ncbi:MAG: hypothetical protein WC947_07230 [Elusimicrobiota bacterium]
MANSTIFFNGEKFNKHITNAFCEYGKAIELLSKFYEFLENNPLASKSHYRMLAFCEKSLENFLSIADIRIQSSLFDRIIKIEKKLREFVRNKLKDKYGEDGEKWWVCGVPQNLRTEIAKRREEDPNRLECFRYLYFIDIKEIIKKNRELFPHIFSGYSNHKEALKIFDQLNELRNIVVHDKREITDEENHLFNELEKKINESM